MCEKSYNKRIIVVLVLIIIFLSAIIIYMLVDRQEIIDDTTHETSYMRWLGNVKLHYETGSHPAFGYKADVNTSSFIEDNVVEIIDSKDGWVKINISGWIPEWYLISDRSTTKETRSIYPTQRRTVKEDTRLYLTPEIDSNICVNDSSLSLLSGQVVELLYEYEDWYYVKRYILWDSNDYPEGWIEKKYLATFDEVKPSEVLIKKGTIVGIDNPIELDSDIKGKILSKEDEWYEITYPGAGFLEVKKEDVIYQD